MRLICAACGAIASLEIWSNDSAAREVVDIISKLPSPVASRAPAYLALFRRGKRGLAWARALKILTELERLVSDGTVHWEGEEERPAPPDLWAMVMDKMFVRKWDPPLEDHNWLRKVVWSEARPLAVEAEKEYHAKPRSREEDAGAMLAGAPKRRGCFTCESFRPPKGCAASSRPVSGNQVMGCDKWKEKPPTQVGSLFGDIVVNLQKE
jgi:hypothetical protein